MDLVTRSKNSESVRKAFNCFFDGRLLYLSYPDVRNDGLTNKEGLLNLDREFINLDKEYNIVENTSELYIESDLYQILPNIVREFKNLEIVEISGSRWFELNCTQFPQSVKKIIVSEQLNLPEDFLNGSHYLLNLEEIHIPMYCLLDTLKNYPTDEQEEENKQQSLLYYQPIADLPNLHKIVLVTYSCLDRDDIRSDWKVYIENLPLLENVKYRIHKIFNKYKNITIFLSEISS